MFDFDLGGGDTRIAFMGNKARTEMGKVIQGTTGIRMELGTTIKIYGMNFQEFIMPMGRLLLEEPSPAFPAPALPVVRCSCWTSLRSSM